MIESIIQYAIRQRYLMLYLALLMAAIGVYSYRYLPIDAVPDITNVQVQINTQAPGYSPLETEQRISFPVETALYGLPNLEYTRSVSRYGLSQVTVVFQEGTDIYFARSLINQRLSSIKSQLPEGLEPVMGPVATGLGEIFSYTVRALPDARQPDGSPYDLTALREIQDWMIKPQLAQVPGVVEINTIGGFDKQYHVTPTAEKLLNYGLSLADVVQALANNNNNQGAGYIERNGQQLLVNSPGQLSSISDIENVVVGQYQQLPVTIKDIASVAIGRELRTGAATQDGKETVLGTAMMRIGENSRQVALAVAARLDNIQNTLPDGVFIDTVYDRTTLVNKAITTVQKNLLEGALLVIVVLFLLLGNLRAALITAAIIPLAMLATITGMVKTGISANLMSLGALDFGLIVDGAVIIVENCVRHLNMARHQHGKPLGLQQRLHQVYKATTEVIRPSLFGVAIITVVYLPIFSLTGVEGKMFHPMAATVVMALLAAMLLSITLVPALVALFVKDVVDEKPSRIITACQTLYRPLLDAAQHLRAGVLSAAVALVLVSLWLASQLGSEFVPQLDEGDIALHAMRIPGTGLQQALAMQQQLEQRLLDFPEVQTVFTRTGTAEVATDAMPPNVSDNYVMLKSRSEWPQPGKSKNQLLQEMEQALALLPGNNYEFTQPIQMRFNELISGVRSDVGIKIFGDDLQQLQASAQQILQVVQTVDGAADARVEQVSGLPMLSVVPDKTALGRYGLDQATLQQLLATAIAGKNAGFIHQGDRRFELLVRLPEAVRQDTDQLLYLPVPLPNGAYVPLAEVASLQFHPAPVQISRENGKRLIVVSVNVRQRDLGGFVREARDRIAAEVKLPSGYWIEYGGSFQQMEAASQRLALVIPLTLLLIVGLLFMAFGSMKEALVIFTGVPLALTGGVIALWLRDMPLSISAGVGFIALSGVAVLNGLVMLSFIRQLWQQHGDLYQAVTEGAITRLRPVLMTAVVASLGFVPMALNTGTGAEVQRPLATVVIGGIISSTLLTLLVLPVLYQWLYEKRQ